MSQLNCRCASRTSSKCHPENDDRHTVILRAASACLSSLASKAGAESKDPYTCKKSRCGRHRNMFGIADNHRVPSTPHPIASAIGLVAQDDRLENSALHIESLSDRSVPPQAPRFAHRSEE